MKTRDGKQVAGLAASIVVVALGLLYWFVGGNPRSLGELRSEGSSDGSALEERGDSGGSSSMDEGDSVTVSRPEVVAPATEGIAGSRQPLQSPEPRDPRFAILVISATNGLPISGASVGVHQRDPWDLPITGMTGPHGKVELAIPWSGKRQPRFGGLGLDAPGFARADFWPQDLKDENPETDIIELTCALYPATKLTVILLSNGEPVPGHQIIVYNTNAPGVGMRQLEDGNGTRVQTNYFSGSNGIIEVETLPGETEVFIPKQCGFHSHDRVSFSLSEGFNSPMEFALEPWDPASFFSGRVLFRGEVRADQDETLIDYHLEVQELTESGTGTGSSRKQILWSGGRFFVDRVQDQKWMIRVVQEGSTREKRGEWRVIHAGEHGVTLYAPD